MSEPAIVAYGRSNISDYTEEELKASLVRAFRDNRAKSVILDSNMRGQKFLAAAAAWAIDKGLLYNSEDVDEGQTVVSFFCLTEKGREEILAA